MFQSWKTAPEVFPTGRDDRYPRDGCPTSPQLIIDRHAIYTCYRMSQESHQYHVRMKKNIIMLQGRLSQLWLPSAMARGLGSSSSAAISTKAADTRGAQSRIPRSKGLARLGKASALAGMSGSGHVAQTLGADPPQPREKWPVSHPAWLGGSRSARESWPIPWPDEGARWAAAAAAAVVAAVTWRPWEEKA